MYTLKKTFRGASAKETTYFFIYNNLQIGRCIIIRMSDISVYIKYIFIDKTYRGRGFLIEFWNLIEDILTKQGYTKITLETDEFDYGYNKLVQVYHKLGFIVNGKEKFVNNGDFLMRKVPMQKLL